MLKRFMIVWHLWLFVHFRVSLFFVEFLAKCELLQKMKDFWLWGYLLAYTFFWFLYNQFSNRPNVSVSEVTC
jgi:hypothetical protein